MAAAEAEAAAGWRGTLLGALMRGVLPRLSRAQLRRGVGEDEVRVRVGVRVRGRGRGRVRVRVRVGVVSVRVRVRVGIRERRAASAYMLSLLIKLPPALSA